MPSNRWFSISEQPRLGKSSSSPPSTFEYECEGGEDDISELYHDAAFFQTEGEKGEGEKDIESIYCSVDESIVYKLKRTSAKVVVVVGETNGENNKHGGDKVVEEGEEDEDGQGSTAAYDDYYDDGECIYEELSSNEGTIYEEYIEEEEEENLYDNADALPPPPPPPPETEKAIELAQKQMKKRLKKIEKAMRRFKLKGDEIPVSAGTVKRDQRWSAGGLVPGSLVGQNSMLKVRAGETVLILRIDGNPPGLWLGKNERSKIGYVECNNVFFDSQSIKDVIMGFHNT